MWGFGHGFGWFESICKTDKFDKFCKSLGYIDQFQRFCIRQKSYLINRIYKFQWFEKIERPVLNFLC